jgi:transcriptional regulator with XRE-family HTH domain
MTTNPIYALMYTKHLSANDIAKETGLTPVTIRNISRMRPSELAFLRLGTAAVLKQKLNIDLVQYIITH